MVGVQFSVQVGILVFVWHVFCFLTVAYSCEAFFSYKLATCFSVSTVVLGTRIVSIAVVIYQSHTTNSL